MHLGAFIPPVGHHIAAWRDPDARPDGGLDLAYYVGLAAEAERGLFDMVFLSDGLGVRTHYRDADELSRWGRVVSFEPLTLLSALSATSRHIGLTATLSTSYCEPFHVARWMASLDHLSGGRAGWNVVTSVTDAEARNFGLDRQADHATRYRRADEFMEVVTGLWDSWDDDAFVYDQIGGRSFVPEGMHVLDHAGEFFRVRGPLNVSRVPQGYPVIIQAGSSPDGQAFAARWAEVVFTAQQTLEGAQDFYRAVKEQACAAGRAEEDVKILPGAYCIVGRSEADAREKHERLQELIDPVVALGLLTTQLGGVDASRFALDEQLPELPATDGSTSRQQLMYEKSRREGLTVRELCAAIAGPRGHRFVLGSAEQVVDQLEDWLVHDAADGYNILPPVLPGGLSDFVDLVVPELQARGLFRTAYEGATLRDHLALRRPVRGAWTSR